MMKKILLILFLGIHCSLAMASDTLTIVIDAGHGGKDPGAARGIYKEKNITLAVALEVGKMIEQELKDVKVVYTRNSDTTVGLKERAAKANKVKANLFVSIHVNSTSTKTTTAYGVETYILGLSNSAANLEVAKRENAVIKLEDDYHTTYEGFDPESTESYIIFEFMTNQFMTQSFDVANSIQNSFMSIAKRSNRGVKQAGLLVLKESGMPAVLIELGFINNAKEAKYMSSEVGKKDLAKSIFEGIKHYRDNFIKKSTNLTLSKAPEEKKQEVKKELANPVIDKSFYTIQFLYTQNKQEKNSPLFRGLKPTSVKEEKGYKYMIGNETDYSSILTLYKDVKKKFPDAFILKQDEKGNEVKLSAETKDFNTQNTSPKPTITKDDKKVVKNTPKQQAINNKITTIKKDNNTEIEYRIQFLISLKELNKTSERLKGMDNVQFYFDKKMYKYTSGSFYSLQEALNHQKKIRKKYKDAFIVKFKDGKRI